VSKRDKDAPKHLPVAFGQSGALEASEHIVAAQKFEAQINVLLEQLESARHLTEDGVELWYGRELAAILGYASWQNFRKVIEKAWVSCRESGVDPTRHFVRSDGAAPWKPDEVFNEVIKNPRGGRPSEDIILSRRAAYLIAENGDPSKLAIAVAQRYFTEQTRRQEIADQSIEALTEDQRRLLIRDEVSEQNKGLASAARIAGVRSNLEFAVFQTEGYKGMYGLNVDGIKRAKGIGPREQILDRTGSAELAANLFRLTQTEERLRKGDIATKGAANKTHHEVGRRVRQAMIEISGVPPESLPAADHIKHARKRVEAVDPPKTLPKRRSKKKSDTEGQ
jgi:DNA-damage-inducible protein D